MRFTIALLFLLTNSVLCAQDAFDFRAATWNLEGNGEIDLGLIEEQLADKDGIDIWGLTEVRPGNFDDVRDAAEVGEGSQFEVIEGSTGGGIRLAIVFDPEAVDHLETLEFDDDRFVVFAFVHPGISANRPRGFAALQLQRFVAVADCVIRFTSGQKCGRAAGPGHSEVFVQMQSA